ncbi:MAG: thiamine-phosphate kinase [Chromatocurvus sp.]
MPDGEFELISRHFSAFGRGPGVSLGVGDDAAILSVPDGCELVVSVDTLVEGVHFPQDTFPEDVGYRCVAVAASDLAAMGARPLAMTLALTVPEVDDFWLHAFSEGVGQASTAFRLPLVGGDTSRGPCVISVQVFGVIERGRALLRAGAQPGDAVFVSGSLGDAAAGLALLQSRWQPEAAYGEYLLGRYYRPSPRLALGEQLAGIASAAIDVSDGLLQDLGHIAAASGCAIEIRADDLPLSAALRSHPDREQQLAWALGGGDDYELCITVPAGQETPEGFTRIGEVREGQGVRCEGTSIPEQTGYTHF